MATFTLNGKQVEAPEGMNLVDAAAMHGVEIPHYCYHPGLSVAGNCRMCLSEIEGARGPQIACATTVKEGLVVRTDTAAVEKMRKGVQEFLLLNHPIDCPICDQAGECRLQDYYMEYGQYENRSDVPKVQKQKVVDIGPLVMLDQERCILCTRCVRFTTEITKTEELMVEGRGDHSAINVFPGTQLDNDYSGNVVDLCPVGALTSKDFRFKMRVWFLKTVKSLCAGCAGGCNVYLDQKDAHVYRYRPRKNMDVNQYWICDAGRLSYKKINENRLSAVRKEGAKLPLGTAFRELVSALRSAQAANGLLFVASPHASLEDNYLLQRLARQVFPGAGLTGYCATPEGKADDFLRRADKTPNKAGLRFLGVEQAKADLLAKLALKPEVVFVMNSNLAQDPELAAALKAVPTLVYLGTHEDETAALARYVFPAASHAEKYGSFVNDQGRVQRFYMSFEAPGDGIAEMEFVAKIGASVDPAFAFGDIEEIWEAMRAEHAELGELSWYGIGDTGVVIPSLAPVAAAV